MSVLHSGRDVHPVAGFHPDGGLASFLIITFARRADQNLTAALHRVADVPVIRQLRRYIEDETDAMNVPVSAIYRAALHTAVLNHDKFVRLFKKLK